MVLSLLALALGMLDHDNQLSVTSLTIVTSLYHHILWVFTLDVLGFFPLLTVYDRIGSKKFNNHIILFSQILVSYMQCA